MVKQRTRQVEPEEPMGPDLDELEPVLSSDTTPASLADITSGVSISFLAEVFRQHPKTVRRRVAALKPVGKKKNFAVYDLAEAAGRLVPPKVNVDEYMKSMRPQDLPPWLQEVYWAAQLKKQKWEENAQDLWRTQKVMDVLAGVFSHIKNTTMLWEEQILGSGNITDEQRQTFLRLKDSLLMDIYGTLVDMQEEEETGSLVEETPSGSSDISPEDDGRLLDFLED